MNVNVLYLYIFKNKFPIELYAGSLIKQNISMINLISCEKKMKFLNKRKLIHYSLLKYEVESCLFPSR